MLKYVLDICISLLMIFIFLFYLHSMYLYPFPLCTAMTAQQSNFLGITVYRILKLVTVYTGILCSFERFYGTYSGYSG